MTSFHPVPTTALGGGVELPMVGFGTWRLRGPDAYNAVRTALDAGYRHIDTASMYRNEAEVGRAVRDSGIAREELFITTKMWPDDADRAAAALTASLRALSMDHVDLWLVHWPPGGAARPDTWNEFVTARSAGRTRAIGVSNYAAAQIDELAMDTGVTPAVNQVPWSPSEHDAAFIADMTERGVVVEGYSPLKRTNLDSPLLTEIAERHGVSAAQIVLRWHIERGIAVIPKSATPSRIAANLDLFGFTLSPTELATIGEPAG